MSNSIGIVGAGAVAIALGRQLLRVGEPLVALASRSRAHADRAAAGIGASVRTVTIDEMPDVAGRVIVAVADAGIAPTAQALALAGMRGVVLHTSGASGLAPLSRLPSAQVARGVLHPLQSIVASESQANPFAGVAFAVAGDQDAVAWASTVAARLGGEPMPLSLEALPSYHAGAVMSSNALTAVIDASLVLMSQAGIDRERAMRAIGPLCRASIEHALRLGPRDALTGPVVRGDVATVESNLAAVDRAPASVAAIYRATAAHLLALARERALPQGTVRTMAQLLGDRKVRVHQNKGEA